MTPDSSLPPAMPAPALKQASTSFVRAIFGPMMLLVAGILFAIDYSGGPNVGRTWPVLIIAAGLLKLGEFVGARNT